MKFSHKKLYAFTAILFTTLTLFCSTSEDPLLQRAAMNSNSLKSRSLQIETRKNAQLDTSIIRPAMNLSELHNEMEILRLEYINLCNDAKLIERDKKNLKYMYELLKSQAYAQRYRPDREDFEEQDNNKSCCFLTRKAITSLIEGTQQSERVEIYKKTITFSCALCCMVPAAKTIAYLATYLEKND